MTWFLFDHIDHRMSRRTKSKTLILLSRTLLYRWIYTSSAEGEKELNICRPCLKTQTTGCRGRQNPNHCCCWVEPICTGEFVFSFQKLSSKLKYMPFLSENTNLSITSLLPPRWIFIWSINFQVDAEFEVARGEEEKEQDSEEDETELWKWPSVKKKESPNMCLHSTSCGEMILQ